MSVYISVFEYRNIAVFECVNYSSPKASETKQTSNSDKATIQVSLLFMSVGRLVSRCLAF